MRTPRTVEQAHSPDDASDRAPAGEELTADEEEAAAEARGGWPRPHPVEVAVARARAPRVLGAIAVFLAWWIALIVSFARAPQSFDPSLSFLMSLSLHSLAASWVAYLVARILSVGVASLMMVAGVLVASWDPFLDDVVVAVLLTGIWVWCPMAFGLVLSITRRCVGQD